MKYIFARREFFYWYTTSFITLSNKMQLAFRIDCNIILKDILVLRVVTWIEIINFVSSFTWMCSNAYSKTSSFKEKSKLSFLNVTISYLISAMKQIFHVVEVLIKRQKFRNCALSLLFIGLTNQLEPLFLCTILIKIKNNVGS